MGKSVRFLDFVSRHRTQSVPTPKVTSLSDPDAGQKSQPHPNNTCYNDDISDIKFNRYYREINADAHHTHGSALVAEVGGGESQCPAIQAMPIQTPPPGMDAKELVPRNHSTYFRPIVKSYVPLGSGRGGEESKSVQVLAKSVSISVTGKGVDVEHKNQASEVTESQFSEDMPMKNKTNMLSKSVMCGMTAEETAMAKQMHVCLSRWNGLRGILVLDKVAILQLNSLTLYFVSYTGIKNHCSVQEPENTQSLDVSHQIQTLGQIAGVKR